MGSTFRFRPHSLGRLTLAQPQDGRLSLQKAGVRRCRSSSHYRHLRDTRRWGRLPRCQTLVPDPMIRVLQSLSTSALN